MSDGRSAQHVTRPTATSGISRSERRRRQQRESHPVRLAMRRGARAVSALVTLILLLTSGLTFTFYNRLTTQAGTAASPQEIEGNEAAEGFDGKDMDILVIGTDTRTGTDIPADGDTGDDLRNTDTIMLIHVPADGSRASVVSFPRDTWVTLPTGGKSKINSAYAYGYASVKDAGATEQQRKDGGQQWLIQTVSAFSGVQIDHFVEVTLAGFRDLTKQVGGIDVHLCQATEDLQYSGADFPAGPQHLDENQALAFVRQRHGLISGDLDRIKRQQYFLGALLRKVLDREIGDLFAPVRLAGLIDALAGTITFDQDLDPLLLAEQMRNVAAGEVEFHTIPLAPVADKQIDGQWVLMPADDDETKAFFQALSAPPAAEPPPNDAGSAGTSASDAPSATVPVQLYLGTGDTAGAAQADLQARGYLVESTSPAAEDYPVTEVQYGPDMAEQAAVLAAALPGSVTREVSATPPGKLIVVAGDNYPGLAASGAEEPDAAQPDFTAADDGCIN